MKKTTDSEAFFGSKKGVVQSISKIGHNAKPVGVDTPLNTTVHITVRHS